MRERKRAIAGGDMSKRNQQAVCRLEYERVRRFLVAAVGCFEIPDANRIFTMVTFFSILLDDPRGTQRSRLRN